MMIIVIRSVFYLWGQQILCTSFLDECLYKLAAICANVFSKQYINVRVWLILELVQIQPKSRAGILFAISITFLK